MTDRLRKHLTDIRAWELIRWKSGCENAAEYQRLERNKRDAAPGKALKEGVSIRQASGLTGIGIGVIRKLSNSCLNTRTVPEFSINVHAKEKPC